MGSCCTKQAEVTFSESFANDLEEKNYNCQRCKKRMTHESFIMYYGHCRNCRRG